MLRRTKIVCTLGPAVDGVEPLARLLRAGMDVARFNFSHGTYAEHQARFDAVREASKQTSKPDELKLLNRTPQKVRTPLNQSLCKANVAPVKRILLFSHKPSDRPI